MTLDVWWNQLLIAMDAVIDGSSETLLGTMDITDQQRQRIRSLLCEFTVKYDLVREHYLAD